MSKLSELTRGLVSLYAEKLSKQEQEMLMQAVNVLAEDQKYNKFANYFPDTGEFARHLYPKHTELFDAGREWTERAFIAANRAGKSEAGAFEITCHSTGMYPNWWTGYRFTKPILAWVGGDNSTTVRDIVQKKLIGDDVNNPGSGMIPRECIIKDKCKTRRNVADALEIIKVKHITGGESTIVLKTYEQGRATWQGTEVDFIWIDEECPQDVYGEALMRLMTTNGRLLTTFTPLQGVTKLVQSLLESDQNSDKEHRVYVGTCSWDDVPHLTAQDKAKMLERTPPQLRDARSKGVPTVGEGLVYPINLDTVFVKDFEIPRHYKRLYGMDVGWNCTAALWGAWDTDNDIIYIYSEHKMGQAEPIIHAEAIKARGTWIRGAIDPASRGRSQIDGETLFRNYAKYGLKIFPANNAVEAGIFNVWERLNTGRLKAFFSCNLLKKELQLYYRGENGKIVKENDHLLDCLRYMINSQPAAWSWPQDENKRPQVVSIDKYRGAYT